MKLSTELNEIQTNLYVSNLDFRFLVLGWCKYLVRPCVKPFSQMKYNSKFVIINDNENKYIMRVCDVKLLDNVGEAVNHTNYTNILPNSQTMSLDLVRMKVLAQLQSPKTKKYKVKHGNDPKVMVIEVEPFIDPKE